MSRTIIWFLAIAAASTTAALARNASDEDACRHDAVHHCRRVLGNDSQVLDCLIANKHRISRGCLAVLRRNGYGY